MHRSEFKPITSFIKDMIHYDSIVGDEDPFLVHCTFTFITNTTLMLVVQHDAQGSTLHGIFFLMKWLITLRSFGVVTQVVVWLVFWCNLFICFDVAGSFFFILPFLYCYFVLFDCNILYSLLLFYYAPFFLHFLC